LSQFTRLTDRQTDRQLSHRSPRWHSMQRGNKTWNAANNTTRNSFSASELSQ